MAASDSNARVSLGDSAFSSLISHLDDASRKRYSEKIDQAGVRDPYTLPGHLFLALHRCTVGDLPDLQYFDIVNYLVHTTSKYTCDEFHAYKCLDAYKYFMAGHVHGTGVWEIPGKDRFLIMSKVTHSQLLNQPPLQVWVVVQRDGIVQSCHCTCMAGLSECCSHAAATLFAVETAVRVAQGLTCTDVQCEWVKSTGKNVRYWEVADIDFTSPRRRKRLDEDADKTVTIKPSKATKEVPCPTAEEKAAFYQSLADSGVRCAVLSVLPDYCERFTPHSVSFDLPPPLTSLYQPEFEDLSVADLRKKADEVFQTMQITQDQVNAIEEVTRKQSVSSVWFQQRAGRVTASNLRALTQTSILKPSRSLIQRICYPDSYKFGTKATRWGCQHELTAVKLYSAFQSASHQDFSTRECGFFVWKDNPHMGASPDGIVSCDCCGVGCLEIKCPYCLKHKNLLTAAENDSSFWLVTDNLGNVTLKRDHAYYFQVQAQIKITNSNYCDFVAWGKDSIYVERITFDSDFFNVEVGRVNILYRHLILPELLGKVYPRGSVKNMVSTDSCSATADDVNDKWCYCRNIDDGTMIRCMGSQCASRQFHKSCTSLKRVPKHWLCTDCKKRVKKENNSK